MGRLSIVQHGIMVIIMAIMEFYSSIDSFFSVAIPREKTKKLLSWSFDVYLFVQSCQQLIHVWNRTNASRFLSPAGFHSTCQHLHYFHYVPVSLQSLWRRPVHHRIDQCSSFCIQIACTDKHALIHFTYPSL